MTKPSTAPKAENLRGQLGRLADIEDVTLTLSIADELVERIAKRAAELVAGRQAEATGDGWLRGADKIADYIDSPRSRVYALVSAKRIPIHHDGSR